MLAGATVTGLIIESCELPGHAANGQLSTGIHRIGTAQAVGNVAGAINFTLASCDRPRMEVLRDKSMARLAELIGASPDSVNLD